MAYFEDVESDIRFKWSDYVTFLTDDEKYSTAHPAPYPTHALSTCVLYPNQLKTEFMGSCGFQPWIGGLSSSRAQMMSQHVGQVPGISGAEERLIQTEADINYAKYALSVSMPERGYILRLFEKFPKKAGFLINPKTTVLYETEDGTIAHIDLINYESNHQYFGIEYERTKNYTDLIRGNKRCFEAGDMFLKSPMVSENNRQCFGINANVAICNDPALAEDGIVMRLGFAQEKCHFNTFHSGWLEYGNNSYAKNLYGDDETYKIIPDIGEKIADHGYLCATGPIDREHLAFVEQTNKYSQMIGEHDMTTWIGPRGIVVDIDVWHDSKDDAKINPVIDAQLIKYYNATKLYYQSIYDFYKKIEKERGGNIKISEDLQNLLTVAQTYIKPTKSKTVIKKKQIDRWCVNVTVKYDLQVGVGFKGTGLSGDKGIFVELRNDDEMPVDQYGRRADIMLSDDGTVSRNNIPRLQEQYTNSGANEIIHMICQDTGLVPGQSLDSCIRVLRTMSDAVIYKHWKNLLQFYEITYPPTRIAAQQSNDPIAYLATIVSHGLKLFYPTDNDVDPVAMGRLIEEHISPLYMPVSFYRNGKKIITKFPIRIAQMYIMFLEKIANTWSSVSTSKTHHHGLPAQVSHIDKHMHPGKPSPVRFGESEMRIMVAYCGAEAGAELLDRSANPKTQGIVVRGLLEAEKPTKVKNLVNRMIYPFGGARPPAFLHNYALAGGYGIDYTPSDMYDAYMEKYHR